MSQYHGEDKLVYMDLFDEEYTVTEFDKVWDVKGMKGNGKDLSFAIPRDVNYGIAIQGIQDPEEQFLPVQLELAEKSEPNVSMGKAPKQFEFKVRVSELEKGKKYALLRYDNFKMLPKKKAVESQAEKVKRFTAEEDTFTMMDTVSSDGSVFYRCVEEEDLG